MSDLPSPLPNDEQLKLLVQEAIKPLVQQAFADYMTTRSVLDPEFTNPLMSRIESVVGVALSELFVQLEPRLFAMEGRLTNGLRNNIIDIERKKANNLY